MNVKGYHRIPNDTMLLDHIFNQSATPAFGWYFFRVIDWLYVNANRLCHRCVFDAGYAQPLDELLQMVTAGKWSWLALARQFARLCLTVITNDVVHLAIDDTLTLRTSTKAPGSQVHHQHGSKPNLASYVRGQCWVSLAMIGRRADKTPFALPLLSRLIPSASNTGKLIAANTLIRAVYQLFQGLKVRVLVDSWYMRRTFIQSMLTRGFEVIGQVRIDTRLYDEPPKRKPGQRGRPRKYGAKYTAKRIAHLKKTEVTLKLYGKEQAVRYRSRVLKARFLNGRLVRVVWCEFKSDSGHWKSTCLLLSTDTDLTPEQVIESYGLRWSIEPMFNQLKLAWGMKEAWQQTRQTLHRWVHITMVGYGLILLLGSLKSDRVDGLCCHSPWRVDNPRTAGQIRKGLVYIFRHVRVRSWWSPTCKKFKPPDKGKGDDYYEKQPKAA